MKDYKVLGAFSNLTALQPGPWSISSSVQCCQAALQLQTLVPCGAGSAAAAYCCALQRFAEQASVDCELNIRHPATTPGQVLPGVSGRRTRRGP